MIYRILQKLNNFSIKFTIFIILLAVVINIIFKMFVTETKYYTEIKYFNIFIFVILVFTLVNFVFTWYTAYQINGKRGNGGAIGIQGVPGIEGAPAKCDLECGSNVAYATIIEDINKHFNTILKEQEGYINRLSREETYVGYIQYKGSKTPFNIKYGNNYLNSELKQDKISEIVVNNNYEIVVINKDNDRIVLKRGQYDKMALSKLDIEEDDIINGIIRSLELNTFITNDFFLNKINVLCHSNNYNQVLRRTGKFETTEYKLIKYLSKTIQGWVTDLVNFKVVIQNETLYPGIRFLIKNDFTIDMFNNYNNDKGKPIDNPFNNFKMDVDGELVIVDGPIKKYDIWRWDEVYSNAPLLIKKCFKKDNLPQGNEPKLSIIKTNSYEPLYTSEVNKDIYDTLICPYNQMGLDATNPNNLEYCVYLETNSDPNYVKQTLRVWKRKLFIPFQEQISIYQPRFRDGKYYYSDPVTNRKYYPVGCVWTGTSNIEASSIKTIFPITGSSCSKDYNYGPQKETILVSGDVKLPIKYDLLWNSDELLIKKRNKIRNDALTIYSEINGEGTSKSLPEGNYNREHILNSGKKFAPQSLKVDDFYNVNITLTIDNTEIPYNYKSGTLNNVGYTDTNNIPARFQFGFEPLSTEYDESLNVYSDSFINRLQSDGVIKSYVIYSMQPTNSGTYYNSLSFDSGLYFKPQIYDNFKKNGACAYFSNIDMNMQEILQGSSQSAGLSMNSQYYACVLFKTWPKFGQGDMVTDQVDEGSDLSEINKQTLWLKEGIYDISYLKKNGFSDFTKVLSFIVLPGFSITLKTKGSVFNSGTKFIAGFYPSANSWKNIPDDTELIIKRVENTITFQPNQCWVLVNTEAGGNKYYIQSAWLPVWLSVNPTGEISSRTANMRFDKDFSFNPEVGVTGIENRGSFIINKLPNNNYIIESVEYPGHYLWSKNGKYGIYNLRTFWHNISQMTISYNPPTIVSIENILDNTYCKDDGDTFITCSTNKTNINEYNNFIMDYDRERSCVYFKGQFSEKYATMIDNHMKFYSPIKNTERTEFYLFKYNSKVNDTDTLYYKINNSGEPVLVVLKYKVGTRFIPLGISSSGIITNMPNFRFKIMNMGRDDKLQPGPYNSISIWRPVPPPGYISLGDIAIKNIGGKLTYPEVFNLAKNESIYQVNNGMGPPVVCVPESCVTKIINNQSAWNNTKGGSIHTFKSSDDYHATPPRPSTIQTPSPCYLWADGITDALTENKNRPYQNFNNDGGYNLFRCTTTNIAPTNANALCYKLKEECLRTIVPNTGFNYPGELNLFGDRPTYMKDSGYFPVYDYAYVESNTPLEYNTKVKSYYIKYVRDAKPNKEQLEGVPKNVDVKGNTLYWINVENDNVVVDGKQQPNNFSNCLMMDCDNEDQSCNIVSTKCNYNDDRMLWRVKGTPGPDDLSGFNPNNSDSESQKINLMCYGNGGDKCIKQYYNPDGQNIVVAEKCDWSNDENWTYKSLNINKL